MAATQSAKGTDIKSAPEKDPEDSHEDTAPKDGKRKKHKSRKHHVVAQLADINIIDEREKGNIIIEPYNDKQLNVNTYDVCLGEYYYVHTGQANSIINPEHAPDVLNNWSEAKVSKALTVDTKEKAAELKLQLGDRYIIIAPGQCLLCHTLEFIGGCNYITTMMSSKSTRGRMNIDVCASAGTGDIGFFDRWTMEIRNFGQSPLVLRVGIRIAQIAFHNSDVPLRQYSAGGHYQKSTKLDELISSWKPEKMLPHANRL